MLHLVSGARGLLHGGGHRLQQPLIAPRRDAESVHQRAMQCQWVCSQLLQVERGANKGYCKGNWMQLTSEHGALEVCSSPTAQGSPCWCSGMAQTGSEVLTSAPLQAGPAEKGSG